MIESPLKLPGIVIVQNELDELFDDLGGILLNTANDAVGKRNSCHIALSGGSTPEPFYLRLVTDIRFRAIPWHLMHIWIVDERRVPEDDDKNNFKMIRETLVDHVPIPKRNVHPMPVMDDDPATSYENDMRQLLPDGRLDFVLLGMGDDGHTASLFPDTDAQFVEDKWIVVNSGPKVTPPDRVTMTYPLLNAAGRIAVLAVGTKKAAMLQQVSDAFATGKPDPRKLPITGINPEMHNGELLWFLDSLAAGIQVQM
ncbi:6-phosphogluconolactonase [bacterium AH-315-I18]|nr:6-phosphogluconolactonase [bacterium AH-315-I18]